MDRIELKPDEVIVREHIGNPDVVLDEMIEKNRSDATMVERLAAIKAWPDPDLKTKWILALPSPPKSSRNPVGCVMVVVYVTIFVGIVAGVAYYRNEARKKLSCPNGGSGSSGGGTGNEPPEEHD